MVEYESVILCGFKITEEEYDHFSMYGDSEPYVWIRDEWHAPDEFFFGETICRTGDQVITLPNTGITYAKSNKIRSKYKEFTNREAPPCQLFLFTHVY